MFFNTINSNTILLYYESIISKKKKFFLLNLVLNLNIYIKIKPSLDIIILAPIFFGANYKINFVDIN